MNTKSFLLFIPLLLLHSVCSGQTNVSISIGVPSIHWDYTGNFGALRTLPNNGWGLNISASKQTSNKLLYGGSIGLVKFNNQIEFSASKVGITALSYLHATPFIGYKLSRPDTKVFLVPKIGLSLGYLPMRDQVYENDMPFHALRRNIRDKDGNIISVPIHDISYTGAQITKDRLLAQLNPRIEFHYRIGTISSIFVNLEAGISLKENVVERDFTEIVFEGNSYQASHVSSLSYTMIGIGYLVKLGKGNKD